MRILWVLVVAALVVPLGTCASVPRSCKTQPLPRLAACAIPEGGWSTAAGVEAGDGFGVTLSGRVTAAGDGAPPDGCFATGTAVGAAPHESDAPHMWWFRAADTEGRSWTVGALVPQLARPVAAGQLVAAQYQWSARGFSPTRGRLEVRDGSGALLVWIGQGGDIPDLILPAEVAALTRGKPRCQQQEQCGTWRGYDLHASTGAAGAPLRYGQESVVGDLRLVHGGYDLAATFTGCTDWYVASILVAAVPAVGPGPAATSPPTGHAVAARAYSRR